jgi:hypothetical protein
LANFCPINFISIFNRSKDGLNTFVKLLNKKIKWTIKEQIQEIGILVSEIPTEVLLLENLFLITETVVIYIHTAVMEVGTPTTMAAEVVQKEERLKDNLPYEARFVKQE